MKENKAEYDLIMSTNNADTLGYIITMQTGDGESDGQLVTQHFIVDPNNQGEDPIREIGRMTGHMINKLAAANKVTAEEAGKFRILWRKIIKA